LFTPAFKNANSFLSTIKKASKIRHFLAYPIKFESHHRHQNEGKTSDFWLFPLFFCTFCTVLTARLGMLLPK